MNQEQQIKKILAPVFVLNQVDSMLKHFNEAVIKYQQADWEKAITSSGKFTEALVKALYVYCGKTLPRARKFSVGKIITELNSLSGSYHDTICLLLPRSCTFIYDIASNRGARHDPDEIDANEMDASIAISSIAWMLSETIRFADKGSKNTKVAMGLVTQLMDKKFPLLENIDGRIYINAKKVSPLEIGLVILNTVSPKRISKTELADQIIRHGKNRNATSIAMTRLKLYIDENDDCEWKIRANGRQKAAKVLSTIRN